MKRTVPTIDSLAHSTCVSKKVRPPNTAKPPYRTTLDRNVLAGRNSCPRLHATTTPSPRLNGPAIARCASLRNAGNGRRTLISQTNKCHKVDSQVQVLRQYVQRFAKTQVDLGDIKALTTHAKMAGTHACSRRKCPPKHTTQSAKDPHTVHVKAVYVVMFEVAIRVAGHGRVLSVTARVFDTASTMEASIQHCSPGSVALLQSGDG